MDLERHAARDLEAVALEAGALGRVVGHQADAREAEVREDLRADAVVAQVRCKAELDIGLDRVAPLVLQRVGAHLVGEADAAAFLAHVEHDALPLCLDLLQGERELLAAVAAHGAERIAREALRVDAHEHILLAAHIALDDGDVALIVELVLIGVDAEVAVLAREVDVGDLMHEVLRALAVLDERLDRDHVEAVLLGEFLEARRAHHVAVIVHDLAAEARRIKAREAREVRRRLRVAGAAQHAALDRAQREDVARAAEGRRLCLRVEQLLDRVAALEGRDARLRVVGVDGDGEGRLVVVRVVGDHLADVERVEALAVDWRADEALGVRRHEVDVLRRDRLGGDDQVALILAVLIVDDDDHLSVLDVFDGLFHRCKIRHVFHSNSFC